MNFADIGKLASHLAAIQDQTVFVSFEPEVLDYTDIQQGKSIVLHLSNQMLRIPISSNSLVSIISLLKLSVFNSNTKIISWDWKVLCSYFRFVTKQFLMIESAIIDLKIIERYVGMNKKCPNNLSESLLRLKNVISQGLWKDIEKIYKNLHLPLITTVIPALETSGILDVAQQNLVYANYEINGQENGRLRCSGAFLKSYVPHAMSPEVKANLKPRTQDEMFLLFDYRGMEVHLLAWLSQDPILLELCKEKDVYAGIFSKITGNVFNGQKDREFAKKFFLPVIYGQSARSLSDRIGIAVEVAEKIIERIDNTFPTVLAYILGFQKQVQETGYARDFFGRRRRFEEGKEYMVRNFAVQAPAAVVCLDKLSHLYFALKDKTDIAYTIHDGYAVYALKENYKQVYKTAYDILSGESQFCPDLRLRVTCRAGRNLNDLKSLARRGDEC